MSYHVYILYSGDFDKYYICQTNNVEGRVDRHNSGTQTATKPYMPWILMWSTEKHTRAEAMVLERKIKNLSKERLLIFIKKYS